MKEMKILERIISNYEKVKKEKTNQESFCILDVYWYIIFTLYRSFYRDIIIDDK